MVVKERSDPAGQAVGDGALPSKAQPVELRRRMTVREAARAAVSEAHSQFVRNVTRLADDFEPELVHHTRVAVRRLRVYLRLFRVEVGRKRAERLAAELRWLFVLLGKLRDHQVFEQTYLARVEAAARPSAALYGRWQRRSELMKLELRETCAGSRLDRLRRALSTLTAELAMPGAAHKHVPRWIARKLDRQHRRALALAQMVQERRPEDLHELRKRLKKLRHCAELSAGLYPHRKKRARRYLGRLRKLQDVLGGFMDQQVARQVLAQLTAPATVREALSDRLNHEAAARLSELSVSLPHFTQVRQFWQ